MNLLVLTALAAIASVEWALAVRRAAYAARGMRWRCSAIVFCENLLAILVLSYVVRDATWSPALAYAAGGALGAWIGTPTLSDTPHSRSMS